MRSDGRADEDEVTAVEDRLLFVHMCNRNDGKLFDAKWQCGHRIISRQRTELNRIRRCCCRKYRRRNAIRQQYLITDN
jgi:hypothetical protein